MKGKLSDKEGCAYGLDEQRGPSIEDVGRGRDDGSIDATGMTVRASVILYLMRMMTMTRQESSIQTVSNEGLRRAYTQQLSYQSKQS